MIVTTSICANYLPKAMVLAKSLKETNPTARFIVCLLEREIHPAARSCEHFDEVILAKDLGIDQFDKFIFKHSIVEASTAVKGQLFLYLLRHYAAEDRFVYLDPDIKVYGELTELAEAMNRHPIVLTPHLCHPEDIMDAVMDNELSALQHGVFNLGFLAVSRSAEATRFAEWWASRLAMFCYDDIPRGIFTDQKWIDLAPCYFDVHILKHPGYNVAPWNLSKRKLSDAGEGCRVNGQPLRFFHYSGFDSGANEGMINKYVPDRSNVVYLLRDEYVRETAGGGSGSSR
ncbi:glycosyltransferase [Paenibacillus sp. 1P03SA]|uniref:glycosyltransferase n=1 Tax=Paenibacillus sp. 1P03SA TaxID=3132294 RepID=UPI0039A02C83